MNLVAEIKTLYHLLAPVRGNSHAERLENFYQKQARDYDRFRKRLLHGREELFSNLPAEKGLVWVDAGAGTGFNLSFVKNRLKAFERIHLVDLSHSLLSQAVLRVEDYGLKNVEVTHADFTNWNLLADHSVDVVTFSYSLTMIPNWFAAIEQSFRILKPGGRISVVDFYVSRKFPASGRVKHSWFVRSLCPLWFAFDNVQVTSEHLAYLEYRFPNHFLKECRGSVPYLPSFKPPFFIFEGTKK